MNQLNENIKAVVHPIDVRVERMMGQILLDSGKIKVEDAERILRMQKEHKLRFGEAARQLGLITDADIEQVLSEQFDYPYLVPGQGSHSPELIAAYKPFSPRMEALRALRSQLMLRWFDQNRKSLAIVTPDSGNGASFVSANLAVVFSQLGERTLLIDANLRTPRQHDLFKLTKRQGLSDLLADKVGINVVEKIPGFVDLSVLSAGTIPPNPQELLGRPAFSGLLEAFSDSYDIILLDTAPAVTFADAQTVAARCGGALMVVRKDCTRLADAARVKEMIASGGAELVGTVLGEA